MAASGARACGAWRANASDAPRAAGNEALRDSGEPCKKSGWPVGGALERAGQLL
ncbi:hypothetical protein [Mucilaginibacter sp. L3T2-6]|uniref:hypothetical protein n=1 Tax=Mucilaginibacter sp. L3T2-6 TaxID=3062491 RepID=UPI002675D17C|nr:hypothetical protein [Mucilaginibacter sp. L3T2-6]MDV6213918.1 hypothetical protein [Mucilaginibacter sp. L3T2-6]